MRKPLYLFLSIATISISMILLSCFFLVNKHNQWRMVDQSIKNLAVLAEKTDLKERVFQKIVMDNAKSSPDFFQKELSKLSFGKKEKERIEKIKKSPAYFGNSLIESRLQILENLSVKLHKKKVYSGKNYQELELSLEKPLLLDEEELILLLKLLESPHPNKPISEILFFSCKRERIKGLNEMFKVDFIILTKEWSL